MDERQERAGRASKELQAKIVTLRDGGAAWNEIEEECGLTRQQARYAYQLGKRAERRGGRRNSSS